MSEPNADPLIALLLDSLIENEEPKAAAHIGDSEAAMSLPELRAAVLSATGPGVFMKWLSSLRTTASMSQWSPRQLCQASQTLPFESVPATSC